MYGRKKLKFHSHEGADSFLLYADNSTSGYDYKKENKKKNYFKF